MLKYKKDEEPTVPCKWCSLPTPMTNTQMCDRCWELERRISADVALTEEILRVIKAEEKMEYIKCIKCEHIDKSTKQGTGTSVTMICPDCNIGSINKHSQPLAQMCRKCCPTGHATHGTNTPRLTELIIKGNVSMDFKTDEYVGYTDENKDVRLGAFGEEDRIEKYLKDYPTPEMW